MLMIDHYVLVKANLGDSLIVQFLIIGRFIFFLHSLTGWNPLKQVKSWLPVAWCNVCIEFFMRRVQQSFSWSRCHRTYSEIRFFEDAFYVHALCLLVDMHVRTFSVTRSMVMCCFSVDR